MYTNVYREKMVEREQTMSISGRIPIILFSELCTEINHTHQTRSEFIKEAIEEKLLNENKEVLEAEIRYMEKKLEALRSKKEQIKVKKKDMNKIPSGEIPFLKETKKVLEQDPLFLKGRISLYKNKFKKNYRISEQEFLELVESV